MNNDRHAPWTRDEFKCRLLAEGERYHIYHPFHKAMNEGKMNREQIQGWVYNRFYYQISIPRKDAAILANATSRDFRRKWIQRIIDHDGRGDDPGGIEAWLILGDACGLAREEMWSLDHVLPGVKFAVDAYVNFAKESPWQDAVCSSLTELFAPEIHKQRLSSWPEHYTWIKPEGLGYFQKRLSQANRDVEQGLAITLDYFQTRRQQRHALEILNFKLDVLWGMLDAMYMAYCSPFRHSLTRVNLHHNYRLQWESAQEAYVLLFAEGMIQLNDSAAEILKLCDGERSEQEVIDELQTKFPDVNGLEDDIKDFLGEAHGKGWIEKNA